MGRRATDMTGMLVGRLTVLCREGSTADGRVLWRCRCICGTEKLIPGTNLRINKSTKSCGCLLVDQNQSAEKRAKLSLKNSLGPKRKILRNYREGAKARGLTWALSEAQACALILASCFYCGKDHSMTKYGVLHNGIDRKDPDVGYTRANCVSCCKLCNRAKSNFTLTEFLDWVKQVHQHQFGGTHA